MVKSVAQNSPHALLSCQSLAVKRQGRLLYAGVGFSLLEGGVLLVVGRNGSGKTTLIRHLSGLLQGQGVVLFRDAPITQGADYAGQALYLGHRDAVKLEASVLHNLRFWAEIAGEPMLLPAAIHYFGLEPYLEMPCAQLSAGWRKRVALARLLVQPAALWLLDEPYTHLDDEAARLLGGLIESRTRKGGAVVIAAHHLPQGALGGVQHPQVLRVEDFAVWDSGEGGDVSDAA